MIYLKNVVTLQLDADKCNGCRMCVKVCPHEVFEVSKGRAKIIRKDYCMECGACALNCPEDAIEVRSGVGCAAGILSGMLNNTEACCGGPDSGACC